VVAEPLKRLTILQKPIQRPLIHVGESRKYVNWRLRRPVFVRGNCGVRNRQPSRKSFRSCASRNSELPSCFTEPSSEISVDPIQDVLCQDKSPLVQYTLQNHRNAASTVTFDFSGIHC
jgi:hypothetical protein